MLGVGWLNFSDPKTVSQNLDELNQGADVLCFVELDCYHECGIRQVIFRRHSWDMRNQETVETCGSVLAILAEKKTQV